MKDKVKLSYSKDLPGKLQTKKTGHRDGCLPQSSMSCQECLRLLPGLLELRPFHPIYCTKQQLLWGSMTKRSQHNVSLQRSEAKATWLWSKLKVHCWRWFPSTVVYSKGLSWVFTGVPGGLDPQPNALAKAGMGRQSLSHRLRDELFTNQDVSWPWWDVFVSLKEC